MPANETPEPSLQERYAPASICFGCGPANPDGLHIRSFVEEDTLVTEWTPDPKYQAFAGSLNGGIIGTLFDCHCNWTAANHLMKQAGEDRMPATVTAEYSVKLRRPTPISGPVRLVARVVEAGINRATVEATLEVNGELCATGRGTFVAVQPGHPAYYRW
jgi:acyl-coenzyme A thioesterase PaaI-like protein